MYSNLNEKEKVQSNVKFMDSDKTNSVKPLNENVHYKPRNYEWITEERNGIRYNRFDRINTLPKNLPEPDPKPIEPKNVGEKMKSMSCDTPSLIKCFILLILLLFLSLTCSLFIWYQCSKKKEKEDTKGVVEDIVANIFNNNSLKIADVQNLDPSPTESQPRQYFPT